MLPWADRSATAACSASSWGSSRSAGSGTGWGQLCLPWSLALTFLLAAPQLKLAGLVAGVLSWELMQLEMLELALATGLLSCLA